MELDQLLLIIPFHEVKGATRTALARMPNRVALFAVLLFYIRYQTEAALLAVTISLALLAVVVLSLLFTISYVISDFLALFGFLPLISLCPNQLVELIITLLKFFLLFLGDLSLSFQINLQPLLLLEKSNEHLAKLFLVSLGKILSEHHLALIPLDG